MTVFLHGFWGGPADWSETLKLLPLHEGALTPDLFEPGPLAPNHGFSLWTRNFHNYLDKNVGEAPVKLVGYSMGARLALAAYLAKPERFSRALLLSGAPTAQANREEWEKLWVEKFVTQPWPELETAWQDQAVFAGDQPQARRREEHLREALGQALLNWSPRQHPFGLEDLRRLPESVQFAYGALDQKYLEVAKTLQELPVRGQITLIPNAGHRLPTDASDFIARWIQEDA